LAKFCKLAGLRGIAIDTKPSSLFYDYRWDGYDFSSTSHLEPEDILKGARTFGKRIARAVLTEFPEAECLLMADSNQPYGPLWTALLEGFLEGMDTSVTTSLHLFMRETGNKANQRPLSQTADKINQTFRLILSEQGWNRWQKYGALAFGLNVLEYSGTPEKLQSMTQDPISAYRLRLAMAKLYSVSYVGIEAGESSTPIVENLDAFSVRTPLDQLQRVGSYTHQGITGYVLSGKEGAALVLSAGVNESSLTLDRETPVPIINIESGAQGDVEVRNKKVVVEPLTFPATLKNLPVNDWVLPASIWFKPEESATPGKSRCPIRFGLAARTQFALSGTLSAMAPEGFTLKPANIAIELQPGETIEAEGVLAGDFELGEAPVVDLILSLPGSAPIIRKFSCPVASNLRWKTPLDGSVVGGFRVTELDGDDSNEIIVCSQAGEVAVFNANGEVRWKRRFATRFTCKPIAQCHESEKALIATLDYKGRLQAFEGKGQIEWEKDFDAVPCPGGLLTAQLDEDSEVEILVAFDNGRIVALQNDGEELWRHQREPGKYYILTGRGPSETHDRVFTIPAVSPGTFECIDHEGERKWQIQIEKPVACCPILVDLNADDSPEIVIANANGPIQVLDIVTGTVLAQHETETETAGLAAGDRLPSNGNEILVGTAEKLSCLSENLETRWTVDIHMSTTPVLDPFSIPPRILVPTTEGTLVCVDADGQVLWRDTRSPTALTVPPTVADLDGDSLPECLFAAADRVLGVIDLDATSK